MRDALLRRTVVCGIALVAITELLSAVHGISRWPLAACWVVVLILLAPRKIPRVSLTTDPVVLLATAGTGVVLVLTLTTALCSPPNSADAMAYHMPRVVYWAEQSSVRFFPTPYLNQIMLQPLAEYFMLHTYVLSGGDWLVNLGQWLSSLLCAVGVSAIAREFDADARGQAIAALFSATIPAGVLASSGAKNDYVLALWLVLAVYFALRGEAGYWGSALGLALLTKATAYLFAPWILIAVLFRKRRLVPVLLALLCCLAINVPHYFRNYLLSGSPLGYDSAQGDGFFRWRNDTLGWKQTLSNALRNASEQLGARSERWNQGLYDGVVAAHRTIGIDWNDPATTWRWSTYQPPRNANHEANAPNRWQIAILLLASLLWWRERWPYSAALAIGFIAFCTYLKWQPFMGRLFLPLFVLGAPLTAVFRRQRTWIQLVLCLFLLNNARPAAFENWVRPLKGPKSVLRVARDSQYFSDMSQWNNEASYREAVRQVQATPCSVVGIDIHNLQLEYPLQVLLREAKPGMLFVHTGVDNVSSRYAPPVNREPCTVVCLDCAGDDPRLAHYGSFSMSSNAGKFVIFSRSQP